MTGEESIENRKGMENQTPEQIKKARIQAIVLGSFLVVALISFIYALVTQTKLEAKIKEYDIELLKKDSIIQNRDSLIRRHDRDLKAVRDNAIQTTKKMQEQSKPKSKDTNKKSKSKKK